MTKKDRKVIFFGGGEGELLLWGQINCWPCSPSLREVWKCIPNANAEYGSDRLFFKEDIFKKRKENVRYQMFVN